MGTIRWHGGTTRSRHKYQKKKKANTNTNKGQKTLRSSNNEAQLGVGWGQQQDTHDHQRRLNPQGGVPGIVFCRNRNTTGRDSYGPECPLGAGRVTACRLTASTHKLCVNQARTWTRICSILSLPL